MTNPMLEIRGLRVSVGEKEILKGVDLVVPRGEVHAIMGPNGSGKSTLSYALAGREGYEITEGEVLLDGKCPSLDSKWTNAPPPACSSPSSTRSKCRASPP